MSKPDRSQGAVDIYTDGACSGNPGPGGWGAVLRWRDHTRELSGSESATTNNRMELLAAISALEALKRPMAVRMFTDSDYLRQGITAWLPAWKARGWRTADRQPVKNQDLWQRLEQALDRHQANWHWVRGHSGNERADQLARTALRAGRSGEERDAR